MPNPYLITLEDVERHLFLSGIQTYEILWRAVDRTAVRYNGRDVTLAALDIHDHEKVIDP